MKTYYISFMNTRKLFFVISMILLLSGIIGYNYMYKEHRDISNEKAIYQLESKAFINEFSGSIDTTVAKYLDKTISLKGKVTEIEKDNFTLENTIVCYTDSTTLAQIIKNKVINVKGRSIGYDELLDLIKLDQVTIINN